MVGMCKTQWPTSSDFSTQPMQICMGWLSFASIVMMALAPPTWLHSPTMGHGSMQKTVTWSSSGIPLGTLPRSRSMCTGRLRRLSVGNWWIMASLGIICSFQWYRLLCWLSILHRHWRMHDLAFSIVLQYKDLVLPGCVDQCCSESAL